MGMVYMIILRSTDEADLCYQLAVNEGDELDREDSELVRDSEIPTPEAPEISTAREVMNDNEDDGETVPDIFQIVKSCLKDIKKLDMPVPRKAKMVMHLTAVTQYVRLRDRFRRNPNCIRPCLNASLAIARRMGKENGAYFARQIRHNENYLLRHRRLPLTKKAPNMVNTHSWITNQSFTVFEGTWLLKTWAQLHHGSSVVTSTRSSFLPWIYLRRKVPFANAQPLTG